MRKSFIQLSRAWYGTPNIRIRRQADRSFIDEIHIEVSDGPESYAAVFEWFTIDSGLGCRFSAYDDGWGIFAQVPELFAQLGRWDTSVAGDPSREDVAAILRSVGFEDATPLNAPDK